MASLSDILTTAQNIASAINAAARAYINVQGAQNYPLIAGATLVKSSAGRVASVSVTTVGSATGAIYDTNLVTSTSNLIYVIPEAVGVYVVNLPVSFGIVVVPGTDQILTVSYS